MPGTVIFWVLFAALLHAGWNAVVKRASDKLMITITVGTAAGLLSALILPFLPAPERASWPFIAGSALCQVVYYLLIANAYRLADLSQTYPLMRGSAPLLVALASAPLVGETLTPTAWAGILLICGSILAMLSITRPGNGAGVALALINALMIASYTLIDGKGVRHSGSPAAYTLWIFMISGVPLLVWALVCRRPALVACMRAHPGYGLIGGAGSLAGYGIVLWAMTRAPVAMVAGLRESSILFAMVIAALVLKEHIWPRQWLLAGLIAVGAGVLHLA